MEKPESRRVPPSEPPALAKYNSLSQEAQNRQDTKDLIILAQNYIITERCWECGHLNYKGYICCHCGKDDTHLKYPDPEDRKYPDPK